MEFGESIEQAARRELREETGLGLENVCVAGVFSDPYLDDGKHCLGVWVVGDAIGEPAVMEPDKFSPLLWRNFHSVPQPRMLAWDRAKQAGVYDTVRAMIESQYSGPDDGHQFHFAARVQGSYAIVGDPRHYDCNPDTMAEPFTVTVRAWSLPEACRKLGEMPFVAWTPPAESA